MTAITARYTYSFEDYTSLVNARRRMAGVKPWRRYALWMVSYLVLVFYFSPSLFDWRQTPAWHYLAIVLGGAAMMAGLVYLIDLLFDRGLYRLVYRRSTHAGRDVTVALKPDQLHWTSADMSGAYAWSAVRRIERLPEALVLFVSRIEGSVLPARAFRSAAEFAAAEAFIRERVDAKA